ADRRDQGELRRVLSEYSGYPTSGARSAGVGDDRRGPRTRGARSRSQSDPRRRGASRSSRGLTQARSVGNERAVLQAGGFAVLGCFPPRSEAHNASSLRTQEAKYLALLAGRLMSLIYQSIDTDRRFSAEVGMPIQHHASIRAGQTKRATLSL